MDVYDNDVIIKKSVFIVVLIYSSYVYKFVHFPIKDGIQKKNKRTIPSTH